MNYNFRVRTEGTKYFFLSMVGISVRSAFSQMTCPSENVGGASLRGRCEKITYWNTIGILLANALSFSLAFLWGEGGEDQIMITEQPTRGSPKGCSSLNLERIVDV
jgi:hypothetical protein